MASKVDEARVPPLFRNMDVSNVEELETSQIDSLCTECEKTVSYPLSSDVRHGNIVLINSRLSVCRREARDFCWPRYRSFKRWLSYRSTARIVTTATTRFSLEARSRRKAWSTPSRWPLPRFGTHGALFSWDSETVCVKVKAVCLGALSRRSMNNKLSFGWVLFVLTVT